MIEERQRPRILLLIQGHPEHQCKSAEAVRMAAGIRPWNQVEVEVCFIGQGVLALSEYVEEFPDGELLKRYLPELATIQSPVLVLDTDGVMDSLGEVDIPIQRIGFPELSDRIRGSQWVCRV